MTISIVILIVYFLIIFSLSYIFSRKQTHEDYLIADRQVSWINLAFSISAGFIGGGFIAGVMSWAFLYGFSVMWIIVGMPIGFILLILVSTRLKRISDKNKFYTFADYIYSELGKESGIVSSFIIFVYFFAWLILQFVVGGLMLSSITGLSYSNSVLVIDLIILIYLLLAGFKAVIKTDFFQFTLIFMLLAFIPIYFLKKIALTPEQLNLFSGTGGPVYIIGFLIIGIFVTMMSGDIWQRIYSAKNSKNLKLGLLGAAVIMLIVGTIITVIGVIIKFNHPNLASEEVIIYAFKNILPQFLSWLGMTIIISSIMSTSDTLIFALSMSISRDVIFRLKPINKKNMVKFTRIAIVAICSLSYIIAIKTTDVSNLYLWLSINILVIAPAVIFSFFVKIRRIASFTSILIGFISFFILNIIGKVNFETATIPFLSSFVTLIILNFVPRKSSENKNSISV